MRISIPAAAKLFGVSTQSIHAWLKQGLIPIVEHSRGTGHPHALDARGMVALAMLKTLRNQRVSVPTIARLAKYLYSVTTMDMLGAFDRGETMLVTAGDLLPPRLMSPNGILRNRSGADALLIGFDLGAAYKRIKAAVGEQEAAATPATATAN